MTVCNNARTPYVLTPYRPAPAVTDPRCRWLEAFVTPGQAVGVSDMNTATGFGGFYDADHLADLAAGAGRSTGPARDLYASLNPLSAGLLDRGPNRLAATWAGPADVLARMWLPIPVCPTRDGAGPGPAVLAATEILAGLGRRGWPAPVVAHAGDEVHLLYRIDLPADDDDLVERVLMGIGNRYATPEADVRIDVYEANATIPLYGVPVRSPRAGGIGVPATAVIHVPADLRVVPADQMEVLARAGGNEAHDGVGADKLGPAFRGTPRKVTPRETLQGLRHCLRLLLPAGSDHLPDRPHEAACRLLADKGLLFSEAIPILVEWDQRQAEAVGVEELEAELIDAMNEAWEAVPGLKTGRTD